MVEELQEKLLLSCRTWFSGGDLASILSILLFSCIREPRTFTGSTPNSLHMEVVLLEQYSEIWVHSSGSALQDKEKYELLARRVNEVGEEEWWAPVSAAEVSNHIDYLRKKGQKMYESFRKSTTTGAPCHEDFDLEVSCFLFAMILSKD